MSRTVTVSVSFERKFSDNRFLEQFQISRNLGLSATEKIGVDPQWKMIWQTSQT